MKELTKKLEIGIDSTHNFFLINGRRDVYLATLLTTLKAYLVSILEKNKITEPKERADKSILDGKIVGDYIHIEIPPEMKNGGKEQWQIYMTVEGSHKFFMENMFP